MREIWRECELKIDIRRERGVGSKRESGGCGILEGKKVRKRCRECEENREGRKKRR